MVSWSFCQNTGLVIRTFKSIWWEYWKLFDDNILKSICVIKSLVDMMTDDMICIVNDAVLTFTQVDDCVEWRGLDMNNIAALDLIHWSQYLSLSAQIQVLIVNTEQLSPTHTQHQLILSSSNHFVYIYLVHPLKLLSTQTWLMEDDYSQRFFGLIVFLQPSVGHLYVFVL